MKAAITKIGKTIKEIWADINTDEPPISYEDKRDLYKEYRSFSGFLPYAEWLDEHDMMLLEDHVSVATIWEIDPVRSEGVDAAYMESIENQIVSATAGVLEKSAKEGQYVLSCYTQDEYSLSEEYDLIESSIHPAHKGSALANEYLRSMKRMFKGMESEQGLFKETMRKGGDESGSSMRPYRGGMRKHRLMLYRRTKLKDRDGTSATREKEIKSLKNMRGVIEAAIGDFAAIRRVDREGFYKFMVRFLNYKPSSTGGDVNRLLKENPCPPLELTPLDGEYAQSMLHSKIETKSEPGVVELDGHPCRFLQIERMTGIPVSGALTAEKFNPNTNEVTTAFDKFPAGSIFVQHIIFEDVDDKRDDINILEKKSRHIEEEAVLTNAQCKEAISHIVKGRSLYKCEMGVYLFADNYKELDAITEKAKVVLANDVNLKAISPENNLFPVQSFVRNLPLVYDPFLDNRRDRGRSLWYHHLVRLMPILGRTRGSISRTKNVCCINFNRRGEMILFDPLDYDGNAHMTLLGPSGLGKSATLNKMIVEFILFKNARIFISEAGLSFDPLMDFLETENMDVQRVHIGVGKDAKPVAPFGNAKKARDDYLTDVADDKIGIELYITRMVEKLQESYVFTHEEEVVEAEFSDDERIGSRAVRVKETKDRIMKSFEQSIGKGNEEEKKDYMGESIMIAKIMVTGGDAKEEARFSLQDVTFLTKAIVEAASIADSKAEELVRPIHIEQALRHQALEYKLDNHDSYRRLVEMADNMSLYTNSLRGKVLNQKTKPFRNCDCLHVELGLGQRGGNEDLLALAYLSLMNMINDVAESKSSVGDDRPIYVITDEAHLILKDPRIAPVAVKIVRMWRKYGAWFLPATQDIEQSFKGEASAILQICEFFIALKPPKADLDKLAEIAGLSEEDKKLVASARAEKHKYTEAVVINKTRGEAALIRIIQPSFLLALAGTEDKEKEERAEYGRRYGTRTAGSTLIQAEKIDLVRGIINEKEFEEAIVRISTDPKYQKIAK